MLAKYWKKIGFFILIVACIFNIMNKCVLKLSLKNELKTSAKKVKQKKQNKNKN